VSIDYKKRVLLTIINKTNLTDMKKFLLSATVALMSLSCTSQSGDLKLWYDAPARQWTDALPLGNGRL
jgi:hypothetical protein